MAELKCPNCGQVFTVDDSDLSSILEQIRTKEFEKDVSIRVAQVREHLTQTHALEMKAAEDKYAMELNSIGDKVRLEEGKAKEKELEELRAQIRTEQEKARAQEDRVRAQEEKTRAEQDRVRDLQAKLDGAENVKTIAVMEAKQKAEEEKRALEMELQAQKQELEGKLQFQKETESRLLKEKDDQIAYYKDLKTKMSTKMIGETLEQHCEILFNQLRPTAFPGVYFEKDNDARMGSKGDYIYREEIDGVELISIMFEMKNEMDTTATKHKNEDFFEKLDKDRKEKNCEYAVLVSMLESDNELYNGGIVDVSYKYPKMYVVRPQCFIPIITLLRNAARNAYDYKKELAIVKNQDIDVTNFEENLMKFKDDFSRNYDIAHKKFNTAIEEIDKTIDHLQKVKDALLSSDNQLRIANNKVEDVSVKKLTKDNPTMKAKFDGLKNGQ